MANFRQKVAATLGTLARATVGATIAWMPANAAERPRPVGEILNVSQAFVEGFPQKYPPTTQVRVVDK